MKRESKKLCLTVDKRDYELFEAICTVLGQSKVDTFNMMNRDMLQDIIQKVKLERELAKKRYHLDYEKAKALTKIVWHYIKTLTQTFLKATEGSVILFGLTAPTGVENPVKIDFSGLSTGELKGLNELLEDVKGLADDLVSDGNYGFVKRMLEVLKTKGPEGLKTFSA